MHSPIALTLLTVVLTSLFSSGLTGDYPLVGVVLLQSSPASDTYGSVTITQQFEGSTLLVEGMIFNTEPNQRFGLHVHEQGDLTNACKSAGAHFNPYARQHGSERSVERHWGDFGNIVSDNSGNIRVSINIPEGSLTGADGYFGRALVLHEREDDLGLTNDVNSKKTGNSGERIACGVIGIRRPIDLLPSSNQQRQVNSMRSSNFMPSFRQPMRTM